MLMLEQSIGTSHTETEILSQPHVWRETLSALDLTELERVWPAAPGDVIVTGCGSTHYLSIAMAALLRDRAHIMARAVPASELLPGAAIQVPDPERSTLIAFSRSGTTTETVLAAEHFKRLGGQSVITVTAEPGTPLSALADFSFAASAATEASVAQTRSFTSMLLVGQAIAEHLSGNDTHPLSTLPDLAAKLLEASRPAMAELARNASLSSFYFLGSGALYGVACEGMLKLKEMSLTVSEAFHTLEFRHGPIAMCDESAAVVGLLPAEHSAREIAVLEDVRSLGSHVVSIGPETGEHRVPIGPDLPTPAPCLYLLPLQLLALERALAKHLNPDQPRNLTAVIHLDRPATPDGGHP